MTEDLGPVRPGDRIAGRYRVDQLLGLGGMGAVYRATDMAVGCAVALKVILPETLAHATGLARFRREAELAKQLVHRNIVRLLDYGESERGLPFIVWELLEGRGLDVEIADADSLPAPRVASIALQALEGLVEAHEVGVIHRDIKPANLFLCPREGHDLLVKILDFGIAKNHKAQATALTREGSLLGTPAYMAPEQVRGQGISPSTDLYALGLVMAEMLAGRPIFSGATMDVIEAQLSREPVPLPKAVLASPLAPLILRATEKVPACRYGSAREMRAALLAAVEGLGAEPVQAATVEAEPAPFAQVPPTVARSLEPEVTELPPTQPPGASSDLAFAPTIAAGPRGASTPTVRAAPVFFTTHLRGANTRPAALLVGAGILLGLVIAGAVVAWASWTSRPPSARVSGDPSAVARPAPSVVAPAAKRFGLLSNQQIRARIEAAGYRIIHEENHGSAVTWSLAGHALWVQVFRHTDPKAADSSEVTLRNYGAVARDGPVILYAFGRDRAAARALIERLDR